MFKTLSSKAKTLVQVAKVLAILAKARLSYGHAVTSAAVNILVDLQNLTGPKFNAIGELMDMHGLEMVLVVDNDGDWAIIFAIGDLRPLTFELPRQTTDMRAFGEQVGTVLNDVVSVVLETEYSDVEVYA